ncbi:hypothetical protein [Natrinema salsiterrestre]|uniref:Uncharacterized protein n=1 Tax=Natrinema salsiterrestre TaxID=2950540 RepID=A0A9Q4L586_9EURY|nr:hypothetical protein [Natrinema salsiterrestre]MDF9745511.1 hypothetical protein [Natrinema salsiterrestre]
MQENEFYELVQEAGHLDTVDRAAVALTDGELRDLKSQLDDELDPLFEGVTIDRENV